MRVDKGEPWVNEEKGCCGERERKLIKGAYLETVKRV